MITRLIERLGVTVAILFFFMAQDAGWIPSKSQKALEAITEHAGRMDGVVKERQRIEAIRAEKDDALLQLLKKKARIDQAMCLAWARDSAIRQVCLDP